MYSSLSPDLRKLVREQSSYIEDRMKKKHLTKETVMECMARAVSEMLKNNEPLVPSNILDRSDIEIEKTSNRVSRIIDIETPTGLSIYKGVVTTSFLTAMNSGLPDKDYDRINWDESNNDSEVARNAIRWDDIVRLSSIYNVISRKMYTAREDGIVTVTAEEVFRLANPDVPYDKGYAESLNNTIYRFSDLRGRYQRRVPKNEEGIEYKTTEYLGPKFFFGEFHEEFNSCGTGSFMHSKYMKLCENMNRLEHIDGSFLDGSTVEENLILSYLVYWHNSKTKNSQIRIDTMNHQLGIGRPLNDLHEISAYVRGLRPLFRKYRISQDEYRHWRITWEKAE